MSSRSLAVGRCGVAIGPFDAAAGDCADADVTGSSLWSDSMAALCSKRRSLRKSSSHSDTFFRRRFFSGFDTDDVAQAPLRLFLSAVQEKSQHKQGLSDETR